jgi:hypothetical protein
MNTLKSTKRGGNQLNYEDTPPELMAELKELFAEECGKRGTPINDAVVDM